MERFPTRLTRRSVLSGGAALAGGAAIGLAGCGTPNGDTRGPAPTAQGVELPTYQESSAAAPDLPGSVDLMAAYLTYPADPAPSVDEPPLTAGTRISVFGTQAAPMVPLASNDLWSSVAKDMGGPEIDFRVAPSSDEQNQKLQTMMAGNDLTDVVQLREIPGLPRALDALFADLTDHLAGDAILDYPNLAALPTWAWESSIFNGRIYTIPVVRGKLKSIPIIRADKFEEIGSPSLESGADFRELCRQLTDARSNQWATGQDPTLWVNVVAAMMGAPNEWAVGDGGAFQHLWETDEFAAAIEQVRSMVVDDKVFHPDASSGSDPQVGFAAGTMVMQWASYAVWPFLLRTYPEVTPGSFELPAWAGGGPAPHFVATAPFQFSGLKKAEPDRVAELLRALNYWAAPLGSKEYTLRVYGVEGTHFDFEDGAPVTTQQGQAEAPSPVSTVVSASPALYLPGQPDGTKELYGVQQRLVPNGVLDPSVGLYSEAKIAKSVTITRDASDTLRGIVAGRRQPSDWKPAMERWRSEGGDQMRAEFEKAFAER